MGRRSSDCHVRVPLAPTRGDDVRIDVIRRLRCMHQVDGKVPRGGRGEGEYHRFVRAAAAVEGDDKPFGGCARGARCTGIDHDGRSTCGQKVPLTLATMA